MTPTLEELITSLGPTLRSLERRLSALERDAEHYKDRLDNIESLANGIEHAVLAWEEKTRDMRYGE